MSRIKFIISVICFLLVATESSAQSKQTRRLKRTPAQSADNQVTYTPKKTKRVGKQSWSIGFGNQKWNEDLQLHQVLQNENDFATFDAYIFSATQDVAYDSWGWSISALAGLGHASGGGNSPAITYNKEVSFSLLGVAPRIYYILSKRINIGVTVQPFIKFVKWPDSGNISARSQGTFNVSGLLDLKIRLNPRFDFYSGIGPLSDGATIWKIGVNYQL